MATFSTNPLLPNDWQIVGTSLNDTLDGGINYTTVSITYTELYGGLGNDLYLIDAGAANNIDRVVELANGGIDTVTLVNYWNGVPGYWAAAVNSYVMPDNIENLNVMGQDTVVSASSLVAPFTNFIIDKQFTVTGGLSIYGNALGNNIVTGNGLDTIYGGLGNDTMSGGTGSDTYYVDSTTDVIIESTLPGAFSVSAPGGIAGILGGSNDTVYSIASYTLATGLERLYLDHAGGNINGTGNAQANTIYGNSGNNNLQGMAGNDNLYGGGGKDTIAGGDGDDLIVNSNSIANNSVVSNVTAYFDPGVAGPTVVGAAAPSSIDGGAGNDTIWGGAGDTVLGGAGNDIIYGDFANFANEKGSLSGGEGNDVFMNFGKADSLAGGGGIDTAYADFTAWGNNGFTLAADLERAVQTATTSAKLIGNALDNFLQGNSGNDSLVGGAGQDVLDGGTGNDTMIGGDGNDSYMVANIGDVVLESSTVVGGDTVHFFGSAGFTSYALGANVENLVLMDGNYTPTGSAANGNTLNGKGNALANLILGNANANLLEGMAGNDTLNGGTGADTLIGGSGDDTYFADNGSDVIQELADFVTSVGVPTTIKGGADSVFLVNDPATAGIPTFFNGTGYSMARNLENLDASAITSANSSIPGGFTIRGNDSANKIIGSRLNDTIVGGNGNDSMDGGAGNDTYYVTESGDVVTETLVGAPGGSADTIMFLASMPGLPYTMGANIENLVIQTGSVSKIIGNAVDNIITGNGADNVIDGGAGNDMLSGHFGNDSLVGGAGNDTLDGGAGNDTLEGGGDNDTYIVDRLLDKITDSGGTGDTVRTNLASYDLSATIVGGGNSGATPGAGGSLENLIFTGTGSFNATGNALNNSITGGGANDTLAGFGGNDTLDGGLGADRMKGGTGDDTYNVDSAGDVIEEDSGATGGKDTVVSKVSFDLNSTVSGGSVTIAGGQKGLVENLTLVSTVTGGAGTTLMGNELANTLTGNELNNLIDGGAGRNASGALETSISGGADSMIGGDGNDTYFVDNIGDKITELASAPTTVVGALFSAAAGNADEIYATLANGSSFSMLANALNVERFHILDNPNTVNGGLDTVNVIGNASDNIIWGGLGANNIDGGAGSDIITGGAGNDTLLGGDGDDVLDGDGLYQDSYMGAWINANLSAAKDSMSGGNGNDIFYVNIGDGTGTVTAGIANEDVVSGGAGNDTVKLVGGTITEYTLEADVENLDVSGLSSALTGIGNSGRMFANALNNTMTGRSGYGANNNKLLGGDGNDTFYLAPRTGDFDTVHGGSNDDSTGDTSKADVLYAKPDASTGAVSATLHASGIEAVVLDVSNNANGFTWTTDLGTETFANAPFALSNFTQTPTTVPGGIAPTVTITGGVIGGQTASSDVLGITVAGNITLTGLGGGTSLTSPSGLTYVLANYNQTTALTVTTTLTLANAAGSTDSLRVLLDNHSSGGLASAGIEKVFIVSTGDVLNNASGFNGLDVSAVTKTAGGMADFDVTGDSSLQLRGLASGGIIDLHDFAAQTLNLRPAGAGATETLNLNNVETSLVTNGSLTDLQLTVTPSTIGGIGSVIGASGVNAATAITLTSTSTGNLTINSLGGGTLNLDGSGDVRINGTGASVLTVTATDGDLNFNVATGQNDSYAFGTSLNSNDIVTDAGGTDTLSATLDGLDVSSGQLRASGVETLNFITSGASGLVDAQFITGATTLNTTVAGGTSLTVQNLDVATVTASGSAGDLAVYLNSLQAHTVTGGSGNDTISGGDLSDTVTVTTGDDFIVTNGGNDTVSAGASLDSSDTIDGGDGTDRLNFTDDLSGLTELDNVTNFETIVLGAAATAVATQDSLVAAGATLTVSGGSSLNWDGSLETDGNFSITGTAAADGIVGGAGNDTIVGGAGADVLTGGGGNDVITMLVTAGNIDDAAGNTGIDTLILSGAATTAAATMDLSITVGDQLTNLNGAAEALIQENFENLDASAVTAFGVVATAAAGGSIILGSAAADTVTGGAGNDNLSGNGAADSIDGGNGNDTIDGGAGVDTITGGAGDDLILWDKATADVIDAGTGTDTLKLVTTTTAFTIDLSQAVDQVAASPGNQTGFENLDASVLTAALTATAAATGSIIIGGSGGDNITGGAGADTLTGNGGNDIFVFNAPLAPGNVDTITDFTSGSDTIELDHTLFESLTTNISGNTISNAEFAAGANLTSSATEGTVILYNWTTGALYYDADANGSGAGELIAILGNAPNLVAADIDIM